MAEPGAPGSQLGVPPGAKKIRQIQPKIGDVIERACPSKSMKIVLKQQYGSAWETTLVRGVVHRCVKKNTWEVNWDINGHMLPFHHSLKFFQDPEPAGASSSRPRNSKAREADAGAPDAEDGPDDDVDGGEELIVGPEVLVGGSKLECKLGDMTVKWKTLPEGVPICPRAAANISGKTPHINLLQGMPDPDRIDKEDAFKLAFPVAWYLSQNGALGYTNAALPTGKKKFSEHEFMKCLGVLATKCLTEGPIRDLWSTKDFGVLPTLRMSERFGIARDRFLDWVSYLRFCPAGDNLSDADKVKEFLHSWNEHRKNVFEPGDGIILDESISKFKPFFDNTPSGIQWLVKIIRKPVGIGAEIKNAACALTGVLLYLELQEGKDAMESKEFCDR